MQKSINLLLSQIILFVVFSCAKGPVYQSAYQSNEFKINELNQEWTDGMLTSTDQGLVYGLTNDDKNLYVKLKVVDERNQRKILMNGLVLWFDTDGKAKEKLGFAFPLINEKARLENNLNTMSGDNLELRNKIQTLQVETGLVNSRFLNKEEAINIISEDGEIIETIPSHRNKEGINIMLYMDKFHILYYEARIPLAKIFDNDIVAEIANIPIFSYGFEIGEFESGIQYQAYLTNPKAYRYTQMNRGDGIYSRRRQIGSYQQPVGVIKARQKTTKIWVKQVKLSQK